MPSSATIVDDIVNRRITVLGERPTRERGDITSTYDISAQHKLRMGFGYFRCVFEGAKVHFRPDRSAHRVEGTFAEFDDGKSVATILDHHCKIAVSGAFSGCAWQIFKVKPAVFYCIHVPRSGDRPDHWTGLLAQYAHAAGWTLVADYRSQGVVDAGARQTVEFVTQLLPNLQIKTVRTVCSTYTVIASDQPQADGRPGVARTILPAIVRTDDWTVSGV